MMKNEIIEPWFSGLLAIVNDWLMQEVTEGRMSDEDMTGSFSFTYETGAKLGFKIMPVKESSEETAD